MTGQELDECLLLLQLWKELLPLLVAVVDPPFLAAYQCIAEKPVHIIDGSFQLTNWVCLSIFRGPVSHNGNGTPETCCCMTVLTFAPSVLEPQEAGHDFQFRRVRFALLHDAAEVGVRSIGVQQQRFLDVLLAINNSDKGA